MAYNFDVSILNPLRFFQLSDNLGASLQTINYATFDANYQTRDFDKDFFARNIPNYDRQTTYCQPYQQGDVLRVQFLGLQNDGTTNQYLLDIVDLKGQSVLTASPTQGVTPISGQYITEFSVPLINVPEGEYFVSIRFRKLQGLSYVYTYVISEPIDVKQSHPNTLLYEYSNSYNTQGIIFEELSAPFHFRVHSALTELNPDSKFTTYEDEPLNLEMLSGTPYRLWTLGIGGNGNQIPQWVADKIERITLCDTLKIDGKLYTRNEGAKLEANRKQRTPLFSWKLTLREKINDNNLYIADYQQNKVISADYVEGVGMIYARDLVTTTTYQIRQFFNGYTGLLQYLNGAFKISSGLGGTFGIDAEKRLVYTPSSTAEATQFATPSLKILPYTLEITTSASNVQVYIESVLSGTTTYAINYNDNSPIIYGTTSTIYNPTYSYSNTKEKTIYIAVDDAFSVANSANITHSFSGYLPPSMGGTTSIGTLTNVGDIFKFCGASLVNVSFVDCGLPQTGIDSVLKSIYLNEKIVNATIDLQQTPDTPCSEGVAKNIVPYIIARGNIVYLDNQFVPASPVNISLPVISGTPQPANNLTCSNGTWTGYPTPNYTRKWQQSTNGGLTWNDFSPQQTGVTYAVQTGDIGSQIRCLVTGQNSQGVATATASPVTITAGIVASAPFPTSSPVISTSNLSVGGVINTTNGTWGGTTPITYTYQWLREGQPITGAISSSYTTVTADAGQYIQCRVTANNGNSNSNVSNALVPTLVTSNTTIPTIYGDNTPLSVLSISLGTWSGYPSPTFTYNWQFSTNGGTTWNNYSPTQIGATYTLTNADIGRLVRCEVKGTNSGGNVTVTTNSILIDSAPILQSSPTISGLLPVLSSLTCSTGTWVGSGTITYSYQWYLNAVPISGATSNTYTSQVNDGGNNITCIVTATNNLGSSTATTIAFVPTVAPQNLNAPILTGSTSVGDTLSINVGTWRGFPVPTYSYNWQRSTNGGVSYSNLGVTTQTYTLVSGDSGNIVRCQVTGTNSLGASQANSAGLTIASASGIQRPENTVAPAITGTPAIGNVLTCSTGTWNGSPTSYAYQWKRGTTNIGTNSPNYTLVSADVNSIISCVVTATNAGGNEPQVSNSIYAYDSDFYAVIAHAITNSYALPSTLQLQLFSQSVTEMKSLGFWAKFDVLWIMKNDNASGANFARINWKNPASFFLTPVTSPTWSANLGYTVNGSNYIDTNFNPATNGVQYQLNDAGRYMWVQRVSASVSVLDGNSIANDNSMRAAAGTQNTINQGTTLGTTAPATESGFHAIVRTSSTSYYRAVAWPSTTTISVASSAVTSANQWVGNSGGTFSINGTNFRIYALGASVSTGDLPDLRRIFNKLANL